MRYDIPMKYFSSTTFKQSLITMSSTALNGFLGIAFFMLVARILEPSSFGVFILAITILTMTSDIANLGTDTGLIRFVGKYVRTDSIKALQFLKLGFEFKLLIWLLLLFIGWAFMPIIASTVFLKPELAEPLRLVLVGVGGAMLFSFVTSAIQAYQKYQTWSLLNIFLNLFRLVVVVALYFVLPIDATSSLAVYIIIPFLGFIIGMTFLPNFLTVKHESNIAKEFFHYNKWVALFIILAAVSNRIDVFLVGRLMTTSDVGIYGVANQLGSVIPQIVFAIAVVVAPKLAGFTSHQQARKYLKKLQLMVLLIALIGLLAIPTASVLIPILFGDAYSASVMIFVILFLAQLVFLISLPSHQAVFYYFSKPQLFVFIALVHLLIMGFLGWFFITTMGLIGIALVVLVGNIVNFLIPGAWVLYKLNSSKDLL